VLGLVHAVPRRLLDVASRVFAWSSWSAPSGCLLVRYLYIHEKTDSAATPRPPEVMICHYGFVRLSYQARALLAVYALATTLRASEVDEGPGSAVNPEGVRSRELARPRGAHAGLVRAPSDTCGGVAASAALLGRYLRGFWTSRGRPCGCLDLPWAKLLLHLVKF
jgi:hypothetical protein